MAILSLLEEWVAGVRAGRLAMAERLVPHVRERKCDTGDCHNQQPMKGGHAKAVAKSREGGLHKHQAIETCQEKREYDAGGEVGWERGGATSRCLRDGRKCGHENSFAGLGNGEVVVLHPVQAATRNGIAAEPLLENQTLCMYWSSMSGIES